MQGVARSAAKACAYVCPSFRRGGMLAGVGLVLDKHRLFSLTGSQAIALIEEKIGLAQPSDGARSRPSVPATYLRIHRVCQRFQAICPWSCAHTFSAEIDPLKPKSPLFPMSQPSGERSNMPTDRKLGAGPCCRRGRRRRRPGCARTSRWIHAKCSRATQPERAHFGGIKSMRKCVGSLPPFHKPVGSQLEYRLRRSRSSRGLRSHGSSF
jgi:hypothetical protein